MGKRWYKKLNKSGKRLVHRTPEERHQVRIVAKKASCATGYFQSLHPAGHVKRQRRRLAALQDAVGWLNDVPITLIAFAQPSVVPSVLDSAPVSP